MTVPPNTKPQLENTSERSVVPCNFRSSGRLSNESTRHLRSIHETFARNLTHSLDLFLGSAIDMKLVNVDQLDASDFISSTVGTGYFVPISVSSMQDRAAVRFGASLLFPILDLLLGGPGEAGDQKRELTEIDEELLRTVTELISSQLERAWRPCHVTVVCAPSVKPTALGQIFSLEERVTLLRFEMMIAATPGVLELVLPMALTNALTRASHHETNRQMNEHATTAVRLRDRLLQCTMTTSAELSGLHVSVGDLIGLQPGDVLNLHAPVATDLKLKISDRELFEITAVRHNNHKAAQLKASCH